MKIGVCKSSYVTLTASIIQNTQSNCTQGFNRNIQYTTALLNLIWLFFHRFIVVVESKWTLGHVIKFSFTKENSDTVEEVADTTICVISLNALIVTILNISVVDLQIIPLLWWLSITHVTCCGWNLRNENDPLKKSNNNAEFDSLVVEPNLHLFSWIAFYLLLSHDWYIQSFNQRLS